MGIGKTKKNTVLTGCPGGPLAPLGPRGPCYGVNKNAKKFTFMYINKIQNNRAVNLLVLLGHRQVQSLPVHPVHPINGKVKWSYGCSMCTERGRKKMDREGER